MHHTAIVRGVPRTIAECELTHVARTPIDHDLAEDQHSEYVRALSELGCRIIHLPALDELPDSVFVEDAAVVVDEMAILTRPGAESRRPEIDTIAPTLGEYRPLIRMKAPATLDGGDVLRIGKRVWVGLSARTNQAGVDQIRALLEPLGYEVRCLDVSRCLHLKTAVTPVRGGKTPTLLLNPDWIDQEAFRGFDVIEVDTSEPLAANALLIDETVIFPAEYDRTRRRLADAGVAVRSVPAGELARAEGGVTCCSIIV